MTRKNRFFLENVKPAVSTARETATARPEKVRFPGADFASKKISR
jgi:hypothetical protein